MINLLPPKARKRIVSEYWTRVATLAFFVWSGTLFLIILLHVPIYVLLNLQIGNMQYSVADATTQQASTDMAITQIDEANQKARFLLQERTYESFTTYLQDIEDVAGADIQITDITITQSDEGVRPLEISAIANTRQALITFLDDLQNHEHFGAVEIPIANLSQSQNIVFSVTIPIIIDNS